MDFQYKAGPIFLDGWRVHHKGDCGTFALTTLYFNEGGWWGLIWSLLTFQAWFWLVKSKDNKFFPRHVVLWRRGKGYIDSTFRDWRKKTPHTKVLPLVLPWPFFRMFIGFIYGVFD